MTDLTQLQSDLSAQIAAAPDAAALEAIRVTALGVRSVPDVTIEAATTFGASRRQLLWGVRLPLALPAVMLALGAELRAVGPQGARAIPIDDFFTGMFSSALEPREMLVEVRVPIPAAQTAGAYEKYADPASGYAVVGVAALVTVGEVVTSARVAMTGLPSHATRLTNVVIVMSRVRCAK